MVARFLRSWLSWSDKMEGLDLNIREMNGLTWWKEHGAVL